jgi:hypothetical protein
MKAAHVGQRDFFEDFFGIQPILFVILQIKNGFVNVLLQK